MTPSKASASAASVAAFQVDRSALSSASVRPLSVAYPTHKRTRKRTRVRDLYVRTRARAVHQVKHDGIETRHDSRRPGEMQLGGDPVIYPFRPYCK